MQIADAELGPLDMDWQIRLASPAQVFDIAVPAMLGPAWDGPSALLADLRLDIVRSASGVDCMIPESASLFVNSSSLRKKCVFGAYAAETCRDSARSI